jgi:hypothetical protein
MNSIKKLYKFRQTIANSKELAEFKSFNPYDVISECDEKIAQQLPKSTTDAEIHCKILNEHMNNLFAECENTFNISLMFQYIRNIFYFLDSKK